MIPPLMAVMRKEFRQIGRDRRILAMLVGAPTFQLFILGFAVNFEVDRVDTAICDHDRTAASREIASGLTADGTFREVAPDDCGAPEGDVRDGRAAMAVVIEKGFARDLSRGLPADAHVLADGSNPLIGRFAANAAGVYLDLVSARLAAERMTLIEAAQQRVIPRPMIAPEPRVFYNPRMKSAIFMVPGVSAMLLILVTTIATAMGLAREREMGTLEQVLVTPIRPWQLLVGKVLPFVIVGLFDVLLALTVGTWVFGVPIRGSLVWLGVATPLYLLSTVGLGLFLSTVSRTQQQALMGGFFVMMPAILLSGSMTPVANMPWWLRPIAEVNPVTHFVAILRGVLLKSADLFDQWHHYAALAAFGAVVMTIAVARFRKRVM